MSNVVIFSVVRDFKMYERCVARNPYCDGCVLQVYDNRKSNDGIPLAYNRLLDSRPQNEDVWYVFCHEDFQLKEPIIPLLDKLDKTSLWGPIGARTVPLFGVYYQWRLLGKIEECKKDGTGIKDVGTEVAKGSIVDTFDCQCLIVHSSVIHQFNLRFDENLSFDLYVEDFCMASHERYGIPSKILSLKACHWSGGNVQDRYYAQETYLNKKYSSSCYTGTSSWTLGGKIPFFWCLTVVLKKGLQRLKLMKSK